MLLIVDDSAFIRDSVPLLVRSLGFSSTVASSATEAYALLEAQRFAAIFLDVGIGAVPKAGLHLLRSLRRSQGVNRSTPVIVMTGSLEPSIQSDALLATANVFLQKDTMSVAVVSSALKDCNVHVPAAQTEFTHAPKIQTADTINRSRLLGALLALTPKSIEIARLVLMNYTDAQIATHLGYSGRDGVRYQLGVIYRAAEVTTRVGFLQSCARHSIVVGDF